MRGKVALSMVILNESTKRGESNHALLSGHRVICCLFLVSISIHPLISQSRAHAYEGSDTSEFGQPSATISNDPPWILGKPEIVDSVTMSDEIVVVDETTEPEVDEEYPFWRIPTTSEEWHTRLARSIEQPPNWQSRPYTTSYMVGAFDGGHLRVAISIRVGAPFSSSDLVVNSRITRARNSAWRKQ